MNTNGTRGGYSYPCQITHAYYPSKKVATAELISQNTGEEGWGLYLIDGTTLAVLVNVDIDHANGID